MAGAGRPIVYDATHLVSRLDRQATSGIDRVDLAYGRHLTSQDRILCGAHYGYATPHLFSPERVAGLVARIEARVGDSGEALSPAWPALRAWLIGDPSLPSPAAVPRSGGRGGWLRRTALRVTADGPFVVPEGAIYLSVAQHAFEFHRFFRWLDARPDLKAVFLVHDLLPLDLPEFFREGYGGRFERRVQTILRYARAIITTSDSVRRRIDAEYARRGQAPVPIHVEPLASPLGPFDHRDRDGHLADHPYFVVVSTVEPRKNHLMLLNVWRALAERVPTPPKLVVVGAPGWDCDHVLGVIARSPALAGGVRHVGGLSRPDLRALIANARALLMPSFAEGYGIPIVEALSLGTPVIASDIPVFREVAQGCAEFLSPLAGEAWLDLVLDHARGGSAIREAATRAFVPPTWDRYFAGVEAFMAAL